MDELKIRISFETKAFDDSYAIGVIVSRVGKALQKAGFSPDRIRVEKVDEEDPAEASAEA